MKQCVVCKLKGNTDTVTNLWYYLKEQHLLCFIG